MSLVDKLSGNHPLLWKKKKIVVDDKIVIGEVCKVEEEWVLLCNKDGWHKVHINQLQEA